MGAKGLQNVYTTLLLYSGVVYTVEPLALL